MNTQAQDEQAQALKTSILSRSATDFEFRQQLLTDPRAAIAGFAGIASSELPEAFSLNFTEQEGIGGVLLPEYAGADGEIPEAELEAVAGGIGLLIIPILTLIDWYNEDSQCKV